MRPELSTSFRAADEALPNARLAIAPTQVAMIAGLAIASWLPIVLAARWMWMAA